MKHKRKAVFVDIKELEEIINQLQEAVRKLRRKAEKDIEKQIKRERLLTAEEVAKMLQIHKYTVYDLVKRDSLPVVRIYPRALRFSWPEVQKWLKQRSGVAENKMRLANERKIAQKEKDKQTNEGRKRECERSIGNGGKERKK